MMLGGSYALEKNWMVSATYTYGFRNSVSGPVINHLGTIPSSYVKTTCDAHLFQVGLSKRF
jgi:long-subunit fatty acid transport protein